MSKVTAEATGTATSANGNGAGLDPFGRVWTLKGDLRQRDVACLLYTSPSPRD